MKKTHSTVLIFSAVLVSIYLVIGFISVLPLRPQSIHQWAQCDRASVALNFANDTYNIFKPRVHNTANGTGITGMEFPLVNYMTGMLYRIFGFHEYLYRILMVLILTLGLIAAYKMADEFLRNSLYAGGTVLLMFLSPVLVYYTPNFIPDTAGLGFTLCGWYFFFRYKKEPLTKHLILLILCTTLASLVKITNLISVAVMILLTLETFVRSAPSKESSGFKFNNKWIFALAIPVMVSIAWYTYASWLSTTNNSDVFLLKQKSIGSSGQFFGVLSEIRNIWFKQYYSKYMYLFILISLAAILIFRKKINPVIYKTTILLWLGNLTYFIFMMAQFPEHDYYIIPVLPVILFQAIAFFSILIPVISQQKVWDKICKGLLLLLLGHGVWFSRHIFHDRYDPASWMKSDPVLNNYFDLEPFVRSLGIRANDRIISAYDSSPEITLYLLNQKGTTVSRSANLKSAIETYRKQADFLVLNDTSILRAPEMAALQTEFLGAKNNVYFYRIGKQSN